MGTIGSVVANYYGRAGYLFEQKGNYCSFTILLTILFALAFSSGVNQSNLLAAPVPTQSAPSFWVQLINVTDDPTQHSKAVAFQVTPAIANIDGLKDAVKAKNPQLGAVPAWAFKVYAHDDATGAWVEVTEPWAPLTANTEETAYHVPVP